jgi:hypothetical protein
MAQPDLNDLMPEERGRKQHDPSWSVSYPGGGSTSASSSSSYDYSGQDLLYKIGDDLSQTSAARAAALAKGDIETALATGRRIADLTAYINAYTSSGGAGGAYDGVFGEVVPKVRLTSRSSSNSFSSPSGGSQAHGGRVLQLD